MNLTNIGTNWFAYLPLFMVLVLVVMVYLLAKTGYQLAKSEEDAEIPDTAKALLRKSYIRKMIAVAVVLVFTAFSMFFAYGPGKRIQPHEESGWAVERVPSLPDEKPLAVIQSEGEANKDKTGYLPKVATEDEYKKSQEEADKAIEEMLKRNEGK